MDYDKNETAFFEALKTKFLGSIDHTIGPRDGCNQETAVVDGAIHFKILLTFNPGWFLGHEICHVIRASDEDVLKPNLGLPAQNDDAAKTHEGALDEAWIIAAQVKIQARIGTAFTATALERMRAVGKFFAKPLPGQSQDAQAEWVAAFDRHLADPKLNYRNLRREWFRKVELIKSSAREEVAA